MKAQVKTDANRRLARIAGQVSGLQRMVEGDRSCAEVLQQIAALRSALEQLGILYLTEHLQTCVLHQEVSGDDDCCQDLPEEKRAAEIKATLTRFLK
jgi:CsoR family transcriptional regulator, copper-sensing transcriptional repressor